MSVFFRTFPRPRRTYLFRENYTVGTLRRFFIIICPFVILTATALKSWRDTAVVAA